ncbi:30S ribosomal protein S20 [Buchnera aphidicola (Formosaphis micheliae)]|uniref:30S ribosomal protein S20 n=1 Tax=Buchnera aphidicola TaxID=9 RepID=UPI0031B89D35
MANIKASKKDAISAIKRRLNNVRKRSMMRNFIKKVYIAISLNNKTLAQSTFLRLLPVIDRFATKGLIHKNKAARHKSNLMIKINKLI